MQHERVVHVAVRVVLGQDRVRLRLLPVLHQEARALRDVEQQRDDDGGPRELEQRRESPRPRAVDVEPAEADPRREHTANIRERVVRRARLRAHTRMGHLVQQRRGTNFSDAAAGADDPARADEHCGQEALRGRGEAHWGSPSRTRSQMTRQSVVSRGYARVLTISAAPSPMPYLRPKRPDTQSPRNAVTMAGKKMLAVASPSCELEGWWKYSCHWGIACRPFSRFWSSVCGQQWHGAPGPPNQLTAEIVDAERDAEAVQDVAPQARVLVPRRVRVVRNVRKGRLLRGHGGCLSVSRGAPRAAYKPGSVGPEIGPRQTASARICRRCRDTLYAALTALLPASHRSTTHQPHHACAPQGITR